MNRKQEKRLQNLAKALREHKGPFNMGYPSLCAFGVYVGSRRQRTYKDICTKHDGTAVSYYGRHVREHFGITEEEQHTLFAAWGMGSAQTAEAAAAFVDEFIERKRRERKRTMLTFKEGGIRSVRDLTGN